jgi:ABC-type arginine/histidine transport system permease subunit
LNTLTSRLLAALAVDTIAKRDRISHQAATAAYNAAVDRGTVHATDDGRMLDVHVDGQSVVQISRTALLRAALRAAR